MNDFVGHIHVITNVINKKVYVGQTTRPVHKRISAHFAYATNKVSTTIHFYRAIRKHGVESFRWRILCQCFNQEDLNFAEQAFISFYGSFDRDKGYNLTTGGAQFQHREETKKRISTTKLTRLIRSLTTPEQRSIVGRPSGRKGISGRPLSEETKMKISTSRRAYLLRRQVA